VKEQLVFTDNTLLSDENDSFIMLAEDDVDDQDFFIETFCKQTSSIKVCTVNNGNKLLEVLNNLPAGKLPLLIILDYNLPQAGGGLILQTLQCNTQLAKIPKIVWSTTSSEFFEKRCLSFGAKSYIKKPNHMHGFEEISRRLLELCDKQVSNKAAA
jgi:CheY-like chemotaxis protein